jgi:Putative polyhydroxyalkanoic acid system protein (PHA_gran_rgn)
MASYRAERTYTGKQAKDIFERTRKTIDQLAQRYALNHEPNEPAMSGKVSRMGTEGRYRVEGEKLTLDLDYSFLIPGAMRRRVEDEVNQRLDGLFA